MRRVFAALSLFMLTYFVGLAAQTTANIMQPSVPSPTAASLGKFGEIPISYFTGVPQISIPLFTAKGKTLDLPISLSYNASGIKIEEVGGWVGMGWALEAGGTITRTVRGIVDEQPEGYFNTGHTFYDPTNWTNPAPSSLIQNIHDNQTVDPEPDQFYFNFLGFSGEMVGGDTSLVHGANFSTNIYVAIPYRKWRIIPTYGTDSITGYGIMKSWEITTEDGTKYTFGAPEVHIDRAYNWLNGYHDSKPYASAWYLTKIKAPGGDSITFQYANYAAEHHNGMAREEAIPLYESYPGACQLGGYTVGSSKINDVHNQSYVHAKQLSSITAAAHTITFATTLRDDARSPNDGAYISGRVPQEPRLDSMTVLTPGGAVVRKFVFDYSYTGSLGGRLTLLDVYEKDAGNNRLPPYSFTYSGPTLPARVTDRTDYHDPTRTASFALDHWGYYNGASGNTTVIPPGTATFNQHTYPGSDRNPNFAYTTAGVLTRIDYPTGGFNTFTYQANEYSNGGSLPPTPVNRSAATSITGTGPDQSTSFTIGGIDPTVTGSITVYISPSCGSTPCPFVQLKEGATVLNTWTSSTPTGSPVPWTFTLGHTYTLFASVQGHNVTAVSINAYWTEHIAVTRAPAGGLRIKEVDANDGMGNVIVRRYGYDQSDGRSSGWLTVEPRYDANRNVAYGTTQCVYYSRSSQIQTVLGAGPIVGYSVVTESLGVNGVFGKTVRSFAAGCDCASAGQAHNYGTEWPMLRYTTAGWTRGQQLSTTDYNAAGQAQRTSTTSYGIPPPSYPIISFRGLAVDVWSMWGGPVFWTNQFNVQTAVKVQTDVATTNYDTTGANGVTTIQHFVYGNPSHGQLTEIDETNSDGTQRITRFKYPGDYLPGTSSPEAAALTAMQDMTATGAAMPGVVIERTVSVKTGASDRVVQADLTTFRQFLTGQYLPYQHFVLNSPSPLP